MTMTRSEQHKNGEQEKGFRNFHENFDLNVTAHEVEQPDVQGQLLENYNSQYSELPGKMEKHKDNHSVDAQQHGEQVHPTKTHEGCVDHLLILAQSAEIVAQSEDGVAGMLTNNQIKGLHNNLVDQMSQEYTGNITADDEEYSQEPLDNLSVVSRVSSQSCRFRNEVTRPSLTQIRKQARCKYLILDQERPEDNQCKHLEGKTIRLSRIKHQARCKSKKDLSSQKMINRPRNEQPQGRILRLSQMKHQARSKGISTAKEGTEEHIDIKEKVIAKRFVEEDICQGVKWDDENIREHQRTARRLRAFKTKKLRRRLTTEYIGNSANMGLQDMKTSSIGLTSMNNSQCLSHNATLLNGNDLLACQHELPTASICNEKLRANFGTEKLQGHLGSNESSGLRVKSYERIPNGHPVPNNVIDFTRLPNNTFQQCDTNMGWLFYMKQMQLKEYNRVVARQHRAMRIEVKRALKDKQQNSKNLVQAANSEAQKEFMTVKRLRLTQLRREVRLGNQCSVIQGPAEN